MARVRVGKRFDNGWEQRDGFIQGMQGYGGL